MEDQRFQHPAYGLIQVTQNQGNPKFFMSEIDTGGYISLSIYHAEAVRHLSDYTVNSSLKDPIVRVRMTHSQFVSMVMGTGSGARVPVTLEWITPNGEGKVEKLIKPPSSVVSCSDEMKETLASGMKTLEDLSNRLIELIEKGKAGKTELKEVLNELERARREFGSNLEFTKERLEDTVSDIVARAQCEITAWAESYLYSLGLEALKEQIGVRLLGSNDDNSPTL